MDSSRGLIAALLKYCAACILAAAGLVTVLPSTAHAYGTVEKGAEQIYGAGGACQSNSAVGWFMCFVNTPGGADYKGTCGQIITATEGSTTGNSTIVNSTKYVTSGPNCTGVGNAPYAVPFTISQACPTNSVADGAGCRCAPGFKSSAGHVNTCEPYTCTAGDTIQGMFQVASLGTNHCQGGCVVSGDAASTGSDGKHWVYGPHRVTGQTCEGGGQGQEENVPGTPTHDGEEGPAAPTPCATGKCPGSVNGVTACYPCATTGTDPGPGTGTPGTGGGTTTTTTAPDGTTTTTTTNTSCSAAGSCTTTTTIIINHPNGTSEEETTTEEEPQKKFCEENPKSPLCKDSAFAGACGGPFTCDGDALQCAMAKEQHKRNCEVYETPNQWSQLAEAAAVAGLDRPDGHPLKDQPETPLSFSSGINQTDALGGGGCPSNVSVTVSTMTVVIPWSNFCSQLQLIGNLSVAVAMLAAAFIVFKN